MVVSIMEAIGKFDFTASDCTELSFNKGDTIKILGTKEDWYRAEKNGMVGYIPKNYIDLSIPSWFQEQRTRKEAEANLLPQPTGAFLVRGSQNSPDDYSISVRHERDVQHFKVLRNSRGQYYLWSEKFNSLNKLVEYYTTNSISKQSRICLLAEQPIPSATVAQSRPVPQERGRKTLDTTHVTDRSLPPRPGQPSPVPMERRWNTEDIQSKSEDTQRRPHPPPRNEPPQVSHQRVLAMFSFTAEEEDELDFNKGDIIEVLEKNEDFWWVGQVRGRSGLFPSNYTTPI